MTVDPSSSGRPCHGDWVCPGSLPVFRSLGWTSLAEAREATPGTLVRRTDCYEFRRLPGAWDGREAWLKKFFRPPWKIGGRGGDRTFDRNFPRGRSLAQHEWEANEAWARAGFLVPARLAYGESRRWWRPVFSLILFGHGPGEFLESWL